MKKVLLLNGPNLGRLGWREPGLYGVETLVVIVRRLQAQAAALDARLDAFQSDVEGELVKKILATAGVYDGILFNPGGYTHTSVALRDALQSVPTPCVEVHLSNTATREEFRRTSLTAAACRGQVMGFGALSYKLALIGLLEMLSSNRVGKQRKR